MRLIKLSWQPPRRNVKRKGRQTGAKHPCNAAAAGRDGGWLRRLVKCHFGGTGQPPALVVGAALATWLGIIKPAVGFLAAVVALIASVYGLIHKGNQVLKDKTWLDKHREPDTD